MIFEQTGVYFGDHWNVAALEGMAPTGTPVGQDCYWCEEAIIKGDRGFMRTLVKDTEMGPSVLLVPIHRECDYRSVSGSLGHILGFCSCYGHSVMEDPQELTKRQAAIAVWRFASQKPYIFHGPND